MTAPATVRQAAFPSALGVDEMAEAVARGAVVLDVRTRDQRARQGVLPGALAVDARDTPVLVDPSGPGCLAAVAEATEVLLVSDDGLEAEHLAWRLGRLGAPAVRPVVGGFAALAAARRLDALSRARHLCRERAAISAH